MNQQPTFEDSESLKRLYKPSGQVPASINTGKEKPKGLLALHAKVPEPEHTNSPDQEEAKAKISEFLLSKETSISLVGPAGAGKTTILKQILTDAKKRKWRVALSAPTHQAAARIREATNYQAGTVHRLLGVSLVRDEKTGDEYLKKKSSPDIQPGTLLVVDESSMLSKALLNIILDFVDRYDCKVIFVGDSAQLNPVKEGPSTTVDKATCPWQMIELTKIHRQAAENPIIALATAIRTADPKNLPAFETSQKNGGGVVYMEDRREWADYLIQQCGMDDYHHRYIAYTNQATDEAAKAIRLNKYGKDAVAHPYLKGEELIVNTRCVPNDDTGKSNRKKKRKDQIVIPANDIVVVKNVFRDGDLFKVECDWQGHHVMLDAMEGYKKRKQYLESLASFARQNNSWRSFFDASDSIADLRSATSITTHSSQGSTFDNVFINLSNMAICKNREELQRLLYVAVTRASGTVYVCGALR